MKKSGFGQVCPIHVVLISGMAFIVGMIVYLFIVVASR